MTSSMFVIFLGFLTLATSYQYDQGSYAPAPLVAPVQPSISYDNQYPFVANQDPLGGGVDTDCPVTAQDPDGDCIPGTGGVDYPRLSHVPIPNEFNCSAQTYPGLYADPGYHCQVFHICNLERLKYSFLCPNGTILDQRVFVCVWWYSGFVCEDAPLYYHLNENFYGSPTTTTAASVPGWWWWDKQGAERPRLDPPTPQGIYKGYVRPRPITMPSSSQPVSPPQAQPQPSYTPPPSFGYK